MNINTFDRPMRRKKRVSGKIHGTADVPRINIFRSNRYIYAQAIDDGARKTVAAFSSLMLAKSKEYQKSAKTNEAKMVGAGLASKLKEKKINQAVYDRSIYNYKGRVKALADGLREGGIKI